MPVGGVGVLGLAPLMRAMVQHHQLVLLRAVLSLHHAPESSTSEAKCLNGFPSQPESPTLSENTLRGFLQILLMTDASLASSTS